MYGIKTSCNGIEQMTGRFNELNDAKLCASLGLYLFVNRFSQMEEFEIQDGELWCTAKGKKSGFEFKTEVIEVGA